MKDDFKLGDANKTSAYLLPLLSQSGKMTIDNFYHSVNYPQRNFKAAFCKCELYPELNNHLFLVYQKSPNSPVFQNFETRLRSLPEYFAEEEHTYNKLYIFDIQNKEKIFNDFWKGKYSHFDDSYKTQILKFYNLNAELFVKKPESYKNRIAGVLYKQEWLKKEVEEKLINSEEIPKKYWVKLTNDLDLSSIPYEREECYLASYKSIPAI